MQRWRISRIEPHPHGTDMLDIVFVAAGLAFFAVGLGYTLLCDRL
jgi:hypothetical protein